MSSPYWNPQHPHQGSQPPQAGGWSYGGPPQSGPVPPGPGVPSPGTPQGPSGQGPEQPLAGVGSRVVARLIDYVLAFVAAAVFFFVMLIVVVLLTGNSEPTDAEGEVWGFLFVFGWGVLLFFYDWLYLITWGRTLGKMLVGIKVVDAADGGKLTQGQVIGRSALFCLPQTVPCLGHLFSTVESMFALGDDRERALHDRAAGTVVIRTRS